MNITEITSTKKQTAYPSEKQLYNDVGFGGSAFKAQLTVIAVNDPTVRIAVKKRTDDILLVRLGPDLPARQKLNRVHMKSRNPILFAQHPAQG